jgi:hypothetical protein
MGFGDNNERGDGPELTDAIPFAVEEGPGECPFFAV